MSFIKSMIPTYDIRVTSKSPRGYVVTVERTFFGTKFVTEFSVKEWKDSGLDLVAYIKSKS